MIRPGGVMNKGYTTTKHCNMKSKLFSLSWMKALPLSVALLGMLGSCSDSVDQGDIYTFTGQSVMDFIKADTAQYSMFYKVLTKAKASSNSDSYLDALLSARGHYTVFLPTNKAMATYLDSIYGHKPYNIDTMSEATADVIAQNSIIDNGDENAYMTSDMTVGALVEGTLNDRHILVSFDTLEGGRFTVVLNGTSHIINSDNEVTNGYVHVIDQVISPSVSNLPSLMATADNLHIFSRLLSETGWADSMQLYRDEVYENLPDADVRQLGDKPYYNSGRTRPPHRYYGYTAFVETDSVYEADWGIPAPIMDGDVITNWDEIYAKFKQKCEEAYPNATSSDLKSKDNAINQFISYHLVPFRVSYDLLCVHFDEMGYNITLPNQLTCDIWAYYLTMDQRRMFKITHTHTDGVYHINRHSFRDNSFNGSYNETSCDREGITIVDNNGTNKNNALNGYYYPIKGILIYDNGVPNSVLNERIRYNIAQNMPELMSNGLRHPATKGPNYYIPTKYQYVKNVIAQNCDMDYRTVLSWGNNGWQGIEGDQFAWRGSNMTMTIKLMPVPYSGTWEIRWGVSHLDSRGLVQVYIGTDPQRMQAVGLPFDLRPTSADVRIAKGDQTDFGGDTLLAIENDQQMRNLYNMKGPKQYCQNRTTTAHTVPLRDRLLTCRRILYRGYLDHNKTYWIKFKTCLDISSLELFGNYVELCPKNVWDNPLLNEDIW